VISYEIVKRIEFRNSQRSTRGERRTSNRSCRLLQDIERTITVDPPCLHDKVYFFSHGNILEWTPRHGNNCRPVCPARKSDQVDAEKLARYVRLDPNILRPISHRTLDQQQALTLRRVAAVWRVPIRFCRALYQLKVLNPAEKALGNAGSLEQTSGTKGIIALEMI